MQSVNNQSILGYDQLPLGLNVQGKANYSYNTSTGVLTITDASVIPSPDTFKTMLVTVYDKFGGKKDGVISAAAGNVALDITALNNQEGLNVTMTLVTTAGITKDGSVEIYVAAGDTTGSLYVEK